MERHDGNPARALVVLCLVAVPVAAAVWFVYRITERTITAIDRKYGDGFWLALAVILAGAVVFVAIGGAVALVRRWNRHIRAKDGLFPILETRHGIVNANEPGAQTLAALAGAAQRVSAPTAARVIDAHYRGAPVAELTSALPEPAPARYFPTLAPVYNAPIPARLALPVGIDATGGPVALPLRNLGNVLVAGLPGSGKSELLASMTAGLLRQDATGGRLRVAMIDTKLVSFGNLPPMAALYARPALEIEDASALTWQLLEEVRRRFQLLHGAGARSLEEYEQRTGERLPYVVGIYDELADMTTDSDRRRRDAFTAAAQEIGRKGRAAGVCLVMATQRPSADVIPSSLRNLAGAAVAFRVSKADDSRLVIGDSGAEALPTTPGRCLVKHADVIECQAHWAGLEGGRFDAFLEALPRGQVPDIAAMIDLQPVAVDGWPVRNEGAIAARLAETREEEGAKPVFLREDQSAYTPEQLAHIRALYSQFRSLKKVQRTLYGQDGGYWFYRIREAVGLDNSTQEE